ncbi:MAG TPA: acyl-CoA thioesterase [Patescibacteria group bacterium]|nr:acyl-CoA thioesterase [Patescibacteria group bacterium]
MLKSKSVLQSTVTMSLMMLPEHANPSGNVHGGEIMKLMDTAAGVAALRHCRTNVVTARVDELEFHYPVKVGNLITCHARLSFVGRSSMESTVTVMVEDLFSEEPTKIALTAFFTLVSLNKEGRPQPVPALEITTPEEQELFEQGRQRYLSYKQRQPKAP